MTVQFVGNNIDVLFEKIWEYIWLIGNKVLTLHSQARNKHYIAEWSSW